MDRGAFSYASTAIAEPSELQLFPVLSLVRFPAVEVSVAVVPHRPLFRLDFQHDVTRQGAPHPFKSLKIIRDVFFLKGPPLLILFLDHGPKRGASRPEFALKERRLQDIARRSSNLYTTTVRTAHRLVSVRFPACTISWVAWSYF